MRPAAFSFVRDFDPAPAQQLCVDRHYLLAASRGALRLEVDGTAWTLPPARAALITADVAIQVTIPQPATTASVLFSTEFAPQPPTKLTVFDLTPLARALIAECSQWGDGASLDAYAISMFHRAGRSDLGTCRASKSGADADRTIRRGSASARDHRRTAQRRPTARRHRRRGRSSGADTRPTVRARTRHDVACCAATAQGAGRDRATGGHRPLRDPDCDGRRLLIAVGISIGVSRPHRSHCNAVSIRIRMTQSTRDSGSTWPNIGHRFRHRRPRPRHR